MFIELARQNACFNLEHANMVLCPFSSLWATIQSMTRIVLRQGCKCCQWHACSMCLSAKLLMGNLKLSAYILAMVSAARGKQMFISQERKWRAEKKLDGLPSWNADCDAKLMKASARASKALCFAVVKQ